jgi:outer membrane receptor protein involved in Fe transport
MSQIVMSLDVGIPQSRFTPVHDWIEPDTGKIDAWNLPRLCNHLFQVRIDRASDRAAALGGRQFNEPVCLHLQSLEPAYLFNLQGWRGRVFLDGYTVGRRYQDVSNLSVLPGYTTLDAGVTLMPAESLELRILGSNITNSAGLTEGNARASALNTGTVGDATVGRPLFGRQITASALYRW